MLNWVTTPLLMVEIYMFFENKGRENFTKNFQSGIWSGLNLQREGYKGLKGLKNGGIRHIYQASTPLSSFINSI